MSFPQEYKADVLKAIETIPQSRALYQNVRRITAQRTGSQQPLQP